MQIFIASDHAGLPLKKFLNGKLGGKHKMKDLGTDSEERCDFPDFAEKVAASVAKEKGSLGILCCGTGIGMGIAANKVRGIRAAVVWGKESAKMAKEHNNANVLCLGARVLEEKKALEMVELFMESKFEGEKKGKERYGRRNEKIRAIAGPAVAVGAMILNEKNQIFLMKSPKWDNRYTIPGGHIEKGETRLEALKREVLEETGLEIYDEKLFTLHDAISPKQFRDKNKHFVMIDYLAKPKEGKVKLDKKEGTEFVWMKPVLALKELKIVPYTKKALEDYVNIANLARVV